MTPTIHPSPAHQGDAVEVEPFHQAHGVGEPERIAHVVEFLGSERSGFMTGQRVLADGGRTDYLSHA